MEKIKFERTPVVCISNQKGGVGKSTTADNLVACMADRGYKTLLVDFDPQGTATSGVGFVPRETKPAMYEVVVEDLPIREIIRKVDWAENLWLAPSNLDLSAAEFKLITMVDGWRSLSRVLRDVREDYDIVIIDTPPSLGILAINVLIASDYVIIPIEPQFAPLEGIPLMWEVLKLVRKRAEHKIDILGYLFTKVRARVKLGRDVREKVRKELGEEVFETEIPLNTDVATAHRYGLPVVKWKPSARGAEAYEKFSEEFLKRLAVAEGILEKEVVT